MKTPSRKKTAQKKTEQKKAAPSLQAILIKALEDLKAQNLVLLDVRSLTDVADTLISASGTSSRQVRALAENAVEEAKKHGHRALGVEGLDSGDWVLADFADIVLHVMLPETREFYDLERLWQATPADITSAPAKPEQTASSTSRQARKAGATPAAELPAPDVQSQAAAARARKGTGKTAAAGAARKKADTGANSAAPAKAGVYAKTGTRKPKGTSTSGKKTTAATSKQASTAASKKPASAKPATQKTTTSKQITTAKKPAAAKPAATKNSAARSGKPTAAKTPARPTTSPARSKSKPSGKNGRN